MNVRHAALVALCALAATSFLCVAAWGETAGDEPTRGFYCAGGIGLAALSYGSEVDAALATAGSYSVSRVDVALNVAVGAAVSRTLYVVGIIDGSGTRLYDDCGYYVQFNTYLFGAGVRWYPFVTGLEIGLEAGASRMLVASNVGAAGTSDWGLGAGLSLAYDFNSRPTGTSLVIGVRSGYCEVSSVDTVASASFFIDIAWK